MKRLTLAVLLFVPTFAWAAPNRDTVENEVSDDLTDVISEPAISMLTPWRFELSLQVQSRDSQVTPMIGPAFGYQLSPRSQVGFRGLFATSSEPTRSSGSYSGLLFTRIYFEDRPTHLFVEPGVGFQVLQGNVGLAGEGQIGFEAWVADGISLGASTGFDVASGSSVAPKLAALTAYRF